MGQEEKKQNGHGGRRPGAGRPKSANRKIAISITLDPDLLDYVNRQENKSQFINHCIRKEKNSHTV